MPAHTGNIDLNIQEILKKIKESQSSDFEQYSIEKLIENYGNKKYKEGIEQSINALNLAEENLEVLQGKGVEEEYKQRSAKYCENLISLLEENGIEAFDVFLKLKENHSTALFFLDPGTVNSEEKDEYAYKCKTLITDYVNSSDNLISIHIILIDSDLNDYNFVTMYNDGFKYRLTKTANKVS